MNGAKGAKRSGSLRQAKVSWALEAATYEWPPGAQLCSGVVAILARPTRFERVTFAFGRHRASAMRLEEIEATVGPAWFETARHVER